MHVWLSVLSWIPLKPFSKSDVISTPFHSSHTKAVLSIDLLVYSLPETFIGGNHRYISNWAELATASEIPSRHPDAQYHSDAFKLLKLMGRSIGPPVTKQATRNFRRVPKDLSWTGASPNSAIFVQSLLLWHVPTTQFSDITNNRFNYNSSKSMHNLYFAK